MSTLAIEGGSPVRMRPFPRRHPYALADARQVLEALDQQTLFFPSGRKVHDFHARFGELYGVRHVVTSTSGTAALHVAIAAINPDPGDEIITTPLSDMGTVAPILMQNCIPVFADVDPLTCNIDPEDVERRITGRTRAILVVHCWGQPAEMDRLLAIAQRHDLYLVEDCAQAHLTRYKGQLVGTIGHIGAFSLQESKHLQCGEGGITITNDDVLGERAALFVDKGCEWCRDRRNRLEYSFLAPNYRMNELQGAVLLAQLPRLPEIVGQRQRLGELLRTRLLDVPGITPPGRVVGAEHSYWAFPFFVDAETVGVPISQFAQAVSAEGVAVSPYWLGKPLYLFDALREQRTYGQTHFPFDSPYAGHPIQYEAGLCPRAEEVLTRICVFWLNERFAEEDIDDVYSAIHKVATTYASRVN